jgi:nicotinamide mononucleotide transporter
MTSRLEIGANVLNLVSIALATLNSWHTWWTGIVGCALFALVFVQAHLYADATLQFFFIATSCYGAWHWQRGSGGTPSPVTRTNRTELGVWIAFGLASAIAYGWMLYRWTDAYSPFIDSLVLMFSVVAQLLLMRRRVESWWAWLLVNSIAVPLYASRGLYVTAALYSLFWINSFVGLIRWSRLACATRFHSPEYPI